MKLEKVPWEARIPPAGSHKAPSLPPTYTTLHMLTPDIEPQPPNERQYPYQVHFRNKHCKAHCIQTWGSGVLEWQIYFRAVYRADVYTQSRT